MRPPSSRLGPITEVERKQILELSPVRGFYDHSIDRESAYERLSARAEKGSAGAGAPTERRPAEPSSAGGWGLPEILTGGSKRQGVFEAMAKSAARSIGSSLGRRIARGILGSILKGK